MYIIDCNHSTDYNAGVIFLTGSIVERLEDKTAEMQGNFGFEIVQQVCAYSLTSNIRVVTYATSHTHRMAAYIHRQAVHRNIIGMNTEHFIVKAVLIGMRYGDSTVHMCDAPY